MASRVLMVTLARRFVVGVAPSGEWLEARDGGGVVCVLCVMGRRNEGWGRWRWGVRDVVRRR
jgi:hypothetical protein